MSLKILFIVAAIVLFVIAAIIAFAQHSLGTTFFGLLAIGLATEAAAVVVP